MHRAIRRDFRRRSRREVGHASFWRHLSVLGSVGWPIVLLAAGGALLGHRLDQLQGGGVRWSLVLLTFGTAGGCWISWQVISAAKR